MVVTDLKMPRLDGIELLKRIKQGPSADMAVIMMTAYGSIPVAVEAMRLGAFDFVTKPFRNEDIFPLLTRIERSSAPAVEGELPSEPVPVEEIDREIVGPSAAMARVRRMVGICARTDANVLLVGETGVGKDLLTGVISPSFAPPRVPLRQGRLHAVPAQSHRERALRTREGLVHRGRASAARAASIWPRAVRSISTTSTTSHWNISRSSCEPSRRRFSSGSAGRRSSRPTCGSSPRPSATC